MRTYTRIIFGLNVLYQGLVGLLALFAPLVVIGLYQGVDEDKNRVMLRAAFRLIGVALVFFALISAYIAKDPDRYRALLPAMGALSVLTLVCWGVAYAAGEMTVAQFGLDVVVQVLLLVAVVGYWPKSSAVVAAA